MTLMNKVFMKEFGWFAVIFIDDIWPTQRLERSMDNI
jgi:hypothetical protein